MILEHPQPNPNQPFSLFSQSIQSMQEASKNIINPNLPSINLQVINWNNKNLVRQNKINMNYNHLTPKKNPTQRMSTV